jgi:hypothetical protein
MHWLGQKKLVKNAAAWILRLWASLHWLGALLAYAVIVLSFPLAIGYPVRLILDDFEASTTARFAVFIVIFSLLWPWVWMAFLSAIIFITGFLGRRWIFQAIFGFILNPILKWGLGQVMKLRDLQ